MGDVRFQSRWGEWKEAVDGGSTRSFLSASSSSDLIMLIACDAAASEPVARNILATELLNRVRYGSEADAGGRAGVLPEELDSVSTQASFQVRLTRDRIDRAREMTAASRHILDARRSPSGHGGESE